MSDRHATWAADIALSYPGIQRSTSGFWINVMMALHEYVDALNKESGLPVIEIDAKEAFSMHLTGPVINLGVFWDMASSKLFYALTSPTLANLWETSETPSVRGTIAELSGADRVLQCIPPLKLESLPKPISLNDLSHAPLGSWKLEDMIARCLIEKMLDPLPFATVAARS